MKHFYFNKTYSKMLFSQDNREFYLITNFTFLNHKFKIGFNALFDLTYRRLVIGISLLFISITITIDYQIHHFKRTNYEKRRFFTQNSKR